ncbi:MAG: class I SAM-dependent methyltransferase [Rhodospirillales bacterium]|nr:class I SAM-dependent methyltransferase [Rhodospirillales bacterium]
MAEIDLLRSLPKTRRDVASRRAAKTAEIVRVASRFGQEYFDGPREYGYGGYRYDGRWVPVARDVVAHYGLRAGDRVLDVGCAKGFLVRDLLDACPGLDVVGLDISAYALANADARCRGRLVRGTAEFLPFADRAFACALALDTVHNLPRDGTVRALAELQRVSGGRAFVRVDSYRNAAEKAVFEDWVLTARTHDSPDGWHALFAEAGYRGDHCWTIIA